MTTAEPAMTVTPSREEGRCTQGGVYQEGPPGPVHDRTTKFRIKAPALAQALVSDLRLVSDRSQIGLGLGILGLGILDSGFGILDSGFWILEIPD